MTIDDSTRRKFLQATAGAGVIGVAGCIGDDVDPDEDPLDDEDDDTDGDMDGDDDAEYELRMGTSSGGTFDVGLAVEQMVSTHSDLVNYSTIEAPGFIGTVYQIDEGVIDGGITDNNTLDKAINNEGDFEDDPLDSIPFQGFQAFPYSAHLVAREETDIETFDDLAGATVYPAEPGFSNRETALEVWQMPQVADIYDEMEIIDANVDDAPGLMEEGQIDAAIAYGTPGVGNTGFVVEYDARVDVRYVEHTDDLVEAIQEFPGAGYSEYEDPVDTFDWQQDLGVDEIVTWDLEVVYAFHPDAPEEAVYELTKIAAEENDTAQDAEPRFQPNNVEDLVAMGLEDYPWHPGAAEYYEEEGVWEDDWVVGDPDEAAEYN